MFGEIVHHACLVKLSKIIFQFSLNPTLFPVQHLPVTTHSLLQSIATYATPSCSSSCTQSFTAESKNRKQMFVVHAPFTCQFKRANKQILSNS
eukprot:Lankesteria_metandrocarpae@DN3843_c0_g1_i2.p1